MSNFQQARTLLNKAVYDYANPYTATASLHWSENDRISLGSATHKQLLIQVLRRFSTLINRDSIYRFDIAFSVKMQSDEFIRSHHKDTGCHITSPPDLSFNIVDNEFDEMITSFIESLHEAGYMSEIAHFYGFNIRATTISIAFGAYNIPYRTLLPTKVIKYLYIPENDDLNCFNLCLQALNYPSELIPSAPITNTYELIKLNLKNIRLLRLTTDDNVNKSYVMFESQFDEQVADNYFNILVVTGEDIINYNTSKGKKTLLKYGFNNTLGHCAAITTTKGFFSSDKCHKCLSRMRNITNQNDEDSDDGELSMDEEGFPLNETQQTSQSSQRSRTLKCRHVSKFEKAGGDITNYNCLNRLKQKNAHEIVINTAANFCARKRLTTTKTWNDEFIVVDTETTNVKGGNHQLVIGLAARVTMGSISNGNNGSNCESEPCVLDKCFFQTNEQLAEWVKEQSIIVNKKYQQYPAIPENQKRGTYLTNPSTNAKCCFLCETEFTQADLASTLFIHHNHAVPMNHPDQFQYFVHPSCNSKEIKARKLPVFMFNHNYDLFATVDSNGETMFNSLISYFERNFYHRNITGSNFQNLKCISFSKTHFGKKQENKSCADTLTIEFKDWRAFLTTSLEKLGKGLLEATSNDPNKAFPLFKQMLYSEINNRDKIDSVMELTAGKGIYPYSFLNHETYKQGNFYGVPERKYFNNDLHDCAINDKDYEHVQKVYEVLGQAYNNNNNNNTSSSSSSSRTTAAQSIDFRTYTNFYLLLDVAILAQSISDLTKAVFTSETFNILNFMGAPGMAETFVMSRVQAEGVSFPLTFLDDPEVRKFAEESTVGGLSKVFAKEEIASNDKGIFYFDVNSMYPAAMSAFPMPTELLTGVLQGTSIDFQTVLNTPEDSPIGYFLDIDCEINRESPYCTKPNCFLPMPENIDIQRDQISAVQQKYFSKAKGGNIRLTTSFNPRKNYKIHYIALKRYIALGVVRNVQINSYVVFNQTGKPLERDSNGNFLGKGYPVFEKIMNFLRVSRVKARKAGNEVLGEFYKLCMNSFFGKTIQNIKSMIKKFSVIKNKSLSTAVQNTNFTDYKTLNSEQAMLCVKSSTITFASNPFIGASILSLAKLMLFESICKIQDYCFSKNYSFNPCYTDTDSVIFSILGLECSANELLNQMHLESTQPTSPLYKVIDAHGTKEFGLLTSETGKDDSIKRFYGISAKCYAYETMKGKVVLKGKGVPSNLLKQKITIEDYANCAHDYSFATKLAYQEFVKVNCVILTKDTTKVALTNSDLKSKVIINPETGKCSLVNFGY